MGYDLRETLDYIETFAKFPFALRRFLRHRLTLEEAQRQVHERMERREENFLRMVERSIYGYPRSPYLALLRAARCEPGDLRALVKAKGVEGALREMRGQGVYVTFEEFKGRKPIVRNGVNLPVQARDFDNPCAERHFTARTGGSTGTATLVSQDLDHIAEGARYMLLMLSAHGLMDVPTARWAQSLPGSALSGFLQRTYIRQSRPTWFVPVGWRDSRHWLKYGLATSYMLFWMRRLGAAVPPPIVVGMEEAKVIARWAHDTLKTNRRCLITCSVSRGVRVCTAAKEEGLDLTGAAFRVGGEPITPAKLEIIQRVGAELIPGYVTTESGSLGTGCMRPLEAGDIHLYRDAFALIGFPHRVESIGVDVSAFNITSLLDSAPKAMLNVQVDDYGIVEERSCGCELESYGYTTHLREIRSYSKLVGEGVTLIGNEMLKVMERVLPERFGGTAQDYQLLEEEDEQGLTRLYLLIAPRVQIADENAVVQAIYRALSQSSPMADAARVVWQNSQTIRIKRMEPVWTERGKLMPLHIQRRER